MKPQLVAYYRVSTARQGMSGLGLEAQRVAVAQWAGGTPIAAEFIETESGKLNDRPELAKAIAYAKEHNARLVIAKLDRLSRNVAFIFQLRDSEVDFIAVDVPEANTLTIGMMAVFAQHEREMISARTRAALQAKKVQGYTLGTPGNLTSAARQKGNRARSEKARENDANRQASALATALRAQGLSYRAIADRLNANGFRTRYGKAFQAMQVRRLVGDSST